MKCFHQMFKDDYELDGVAISFCGLIDVENAVIDAVWAQGIPCRDVIRQFDSCKIINISNVAYIALFLCQIFFLFCCTDVVRRCNVWYNRSI